MSAKNTSLVAISTALAIVLLVAIGLITYKHFSNKEEARLLLSQGKKENITISNKRIKNRFAIYQSGVPRMNRTYLLSGFINTADNSKFGVVDPSCKVDVAKGQFCLADFSAGFKVNLETYHEMQEGDKIEVYCMKVDGKHICKPTKTVHSYFD
jgi:hypothetical protein